MLGCAFVERVCVVLLAVPATAANGFLNVTSMDYSEVVINRMKALHEELHPSLKWVHDDVRTLETFGANTRRLGA